MIENSEAWASRAKDVLSTVRPSLHAGQAYELVHFATSMLASLYGPNSSQLKAFLSGQEQLSKSKDTAANSIVFLQSGHAHSAIKNALAELEAGLIVNVRVLVAGEIMVELLRLSKDALDDPGEAAKNVAAVLTAAAYEDFDPQDGGKMFAGVKGRPDLQNVIIALKEAGILAGGQPGIAQSYLKFRNDALHADWTKVDRSQIQSCIGFLEGLLTKHFS